MSGPVLLASKPCRMNLPAGQVKEDAGKIIIHLEASLLLLEDDEAAVYLMCDGKTAVREILQRLTAEHDASEEEVWDQLAPFLTDLSARKLITWQQDNN